MTVQLSISYFDTEEGLKHDIWRSGVIARVSYFLLFPSVSFLNYFMIDYHVFRNISREKRESDDSKRKI